MTGAQFLKRKDRHSFAVPEDGSFDAALAPFLAELNVIKKSAETNVAKAEEKQRFLPLDSRFHPPNPFNSSSTHRILHLAIQVLADGSPRILLAFAQD